MASRGRIFVNVRKNIRNFPSLTSSREGEYSYIRNFRVAFTPGRVGITGKKLLLSYLSDNEDSPLPFEWPTGHPDYAARF
jgi:hypothetical protein